MEITPLDGQTMKPEVMDPNMNVSIPHISLIYCIDRTYLDHPVGGAVFVYGRIVVDIILTVSLVTANIILIVAIAMFRRRHRGTTKVYNSGASMKLVQLLALSDVFVGLTVPVYLIPHYFCDINDLMRGNIYVCMMKYVGIVFSTAMSNLSLLAIAVDRYLAIKYSLKYRLIMTHRVCHGAIASIFIFALIASCVLFFWNGWTPDSYCDLEDVVPDSYVLGLGIATHVTMLVMVIGVHYKMHQKAAEHASRRSIMELRVSRLSIVNAKSAKVVMLVSGAYVLCWTPYSICLMARMMQKESSVLMDFFYQITFPLSYANSLVNPFIYAWKNTEIQNALIWSFRRASFGAT